MLRSSLSLVYTSDIFSAVSVGLLSMESSLNVSLVFTYMFTSHTLDENLGVLVDEYIRLGLSGIGKSPLHTIENALRAA